MIISKVILNYITSTNSAKQKPCGLNFYCGVTKNKTIMNGKGMTLSRKEVEQRKAKRKLETKRAKLSAGLNRLGKGKHPFAKFK